MSSIFVTALFDASFVRSWRSNSKLFWAAQKRKTRPTNRLEHVKIDVRCQIRPCNRFWVDFGGSGPPFGASGRSLGLPGAPLGGPWAPPGRPWSAPGGSLGTLLVVFDAVLCAPGRRLGDRAGPWRFLRPRMHRTREGLQKWYRIRNPSHVSCCPDRGKRERGRVFCLLRATPLALCAVTTV